ncbi:glycoside hydrolase family 17 protein [Bipolaris oryzae ATCC 44560]|uniref:glucan endo-1,3-beta-D-glucosidase n=1 Tax=Bipolaris oryzae ATCC 44560 TaxID=930090 RepID=W6YPD7_COCMI|nr:glycoside hydrolase family 17 protein [Bipolaris oryzae ATCC 44560]EUC41227.1 glycoside hydrolase family 17 protein [Bipolaris oryzae ATCC 44560]
MVIHRQFTACESASVNDAAIHSDQINYILLIRIYTGFNYGAFWSVEANVKKKADFLDGFKLAKNLTTDIPFDSARLFTCKTAGTVDEPTEAFDAAVESKTNLLLGFWITPARSGDSPDENVKNEMAALEKGFKKHGQALSDLIIGLSVGSEDIYRAEEAGELGLTAEVIGQIIAKVKESIAASSFAQYMKDKPIGHVDTAKHCVVDNADFIGMTAYPYWNKDSIDTASDSFQYSLEEVKQRAGNRPVWIAEMGWPSTDTEQHGAAVAGIDELQKFWTEVGCVVFGKYTAFWYELLKDSTPDQKADWGLIDTLSRKPHIKDLSCGAPKQSRPAAPSADSQFTLQSSLLASNGLSGFKVPDPSTTLSSSEIQPSPGISNVTLSKVGPSTTYVTVYKTTTITSTPKMWSNTSFSSVAGTKMITQSITVLSPFTSKTPSDRSLSYFTTTSMPGTS